MSHPAIAVLEIAAGDELQRLAIAVVCTFAQQAPTLIGIISTQQIGSFRLAITLNESL
jgi:hypothetical protein